MSSLGPTMKRLIIITLGGILLIAFISLGIYNLAKTQNKFKFKEVELRSQSLEIDTLNTRYELLNKELQQSKDLNSEQLDKLEKEKQELELKKQELERQLQAKLDAKNKQQQALASASNTIINKATGTQVAYASGGSKEQWMTQAGIPQAEWQYVDYIVSRESGWKPCAYYPSKNDCSASPTSACGLAQSLPCGKQSKFGHWTDPVANLKWQYEYVTGRYGGYKQAYEFWSINHWY